MGERVNTEWLPSPNHNARPRGAGPELIVIHATAGRSETGDVVWCRTPKERLPEGYGPVSYHYIIGRTGKVYQLVQEARRAWHAGVSKWNGRRGCNDFSIGVALSHHPDEGDYPHAQMDAAATLVADICRRRGLDGSRIVGHADISPGRKTDPYAHFPWPDFRVAVINLLHPPPDPLDAAAYIPPERWRPAA